jgi:drug/metabolite transporter (DMT)-like permease
VTRARTAIFTAAALIGFAANSILCRLALRPREIDAASFTAVRLLTGAAVLALLAGPRRALRAGSWASAAALFIYAAPFSFAYLRLDAGIGALLLFGAVQLTMIGAGLRFGERPLANEWMGFVIAATGFVALAAPGTTAPDPIAATLMATAGVSWGIYSLRGRRASDPLASTAGNFLRAAPFSLVLAAVTVLVVRLASPIIGTPAALHASPKGLALAAASGGLASGLGYTLWYAALRELSATRAAILQLAVPVLTAAGAVALLGERITLRLLCAGAAILGGVAIALARRRR